MKGATPGSRARSRADGRRDPLPLTMRPVVGAVVLLVGGGPPAVSDDYARVDRVSRHVLEIMKKYETPGVSIAVFREFEIEWARGYGVANADTRAPVEPLTLFQAASISKPVAALAALRLVEAGQLDLDRNVNAYLKGWKLPDNELTAARAVTLRMILSHAAGLTVHGFPGYEAGSPVPTVPQILDGLPPANSEPVRVTVAPATKFQYSGGGTTILQQLLVDVTGIPFCELMRKQVLDPVGMRFSTYEQPLPGWLAKYATAGHDHGKVVKGERHTYPEMAAAGLTTTASDLARFAIAVQRARLGLSSVLSRPEALLMTTPYLPDGFGLGFELFPAGEKDKKYFGHGGGNRGYRGWLFASLDGGKGIVILTNGEEWKTVSEIADKVREEYGL
jgi:CubicO group peptidase (beta-lactamase class C family)